MHSNWGNKCRVTVIEKISRASKIYKGLRADPQTLLMARTVRCPKFLLTARCSPTNLTVPCGSETDGSSRYDVGSSGEHHQLWLPLCLPGLPPCPLAWACRCQVQFCTVSSTRALRSEQEAKTKFMVLFATLGSLPNSRHLPICQLEQTHWFSSSLKPIYLFLITSVW